MRIAVLSTLAFGGAATAARRLTRALADFGHECSFFVLENPCNPPSIPLLDNDAAFWLPALFRHWSALSDPEVLAANATELFTDALTALHTSLSSLPQAIRKAEVIHLHWSSGMLFSPALLQAMAGKKVIFTLHDENPFTGGCHYAGTCQKFRTRCGDCPLLKKSGPDDESARCFRLKERLYPLLNPSFVTPSAWLAEKVKISALLGTYPVTVIPNPLALETFQPPPDRLILRKKFDLPADALVILSGCEYLGNSRKNTRAFFEAIALLSKRHKIRTSSVVFATYGHGQPPKSSLPIRHYGHMGDEAVLAELYGAADLFVHTSLQDNLPLSLCEAQACGTPTVGFAVGGSPETMLLDKTGFLVAETTSRALTERLRAIITDHDRLSVMREAARAFAKERFDPRTAASAYTKIFKNTRTARELTPDSSLFVDLMQNQIASLASFFYDYGKGQATQNGFPDKRAERIGARPVEQVKQLGEIEARLADQARQIWKLRHPFRRLYRNLRVLFGVTK